MAGRQDRGAVVVTGASSGIGAATASMLAEAGFLVFAGVRNQPDAERAESLGANVRAVLLDVTDSRSIEIAKRAVSQTGVPLAGIVNNAGIAVAGPLEFLALDELRKQFEVNVIGALAITQAFLPLLRANRARIVFMGSVSGRIAVPFIAPYSASKFALRAIADALRIELAAASIYVSLIEPGSVKTPIWRKGREAQSTMQQRLGADGLAYYGSALEAVIRQTEREEQAGMPAERVARVVLEALTAQRPRAHYVVGAPARLGIILGWLPAAIHDRIMRASMRL